jgi:hypothetical protein
MNKLLNGNGNLTELGEKFLLEFNMALEHVLTSDEVCDMSESEIRTLGSVLSAKIGQAVTKRVSRRLQEAGVFNAMSDAEFENHLREKYGSNWAFVTLTPEEFARLPAVDLDAAILAARDVGTAIIQYMNSNGVRLK